MKIVCESCGAKYSIADEKVAGKVFKIRCKKCSAVIVVKGDQQQQAESEPSAAAPDAGDAIWHVVVAGEQQGPFAPRQIGELLADGKIDWEAYVWREGMDNWQPAKDVEALVKAVMAESEGGEASAAASANPPSGEVFGGSSDMGADPFASSDDGGLSGVIGSSNTATAAASASVDLFADSSRSAFAAGGDDDDVMPGSSRSAVGGPSPKVSQAESMTGQRNENSVLFSLSNLQALATGSGAAPSAPARGKPGMAQGEGSGLIDIRALASATQSMAEKPNGSSRDKVEDLLAVGATNTTFSSTALAAPVAVEKPDHSKTLLYGMGAAIAALGIAVAFLMTRESPPQQAAITPAQEQTPAAVAAANPQAAAPQAAVPAPSAPTEAKEPAAQGSQEKEADDESDSDRSSRRHRERSDRERSSERSEKSEKSEKAEAPAPAPEPKKTSSGDKSLDDLLDTALGGGSKPKSAAAPAKPAASENLPSTPSRDDVLGAMKGITPKVQACGGGQSGIAMAKVNVAGPTGKVTSVDVGGQFAGTPVASCVSKEVQKARLPKFSQSTFSFSYPFKI